MRAILTFLALIWTLPAWAEGTALFSMETRDDGRRWEAVGRLEIAGNAFCTGALIEPTLVLTAAHCLYDAETGARVPEAEIQFLAGWRNGRAAAYRRVKRAVSHPEYRFEGPPGAERVRNDVALIELQHPIRNTSITPFETDMSPATGDEIGVVSYAFNRSEAPALQEMCAVLGQQEGVLVLSCEVDFGSSGSPVFSFDSGRPRIVSVVSAKADVEGRPVSLGTALELPVALIKRELGQNAVRNALPAGTRKQTGAKFVTPSN